MSHRQSRDIASSLVRRCRRRSQRSSLLHHSTPLWRFMHSDSQVDSLTSASVNLPPDSAPLSTSQNESVDDFPEEQDWIHKLNLTPYRPSPASTRQTQVTTSDELAKDHVAEENSETVEADAFSDSPIDETQYLKALRSKFPLYQ